MIFNSKHLENKIESMEKSFDMQNKLFSQFLAKLETMFEVMQKKSDDNMAWMKSLHEMALQEYVSGPKKRVYAFLYHKQREDESRLIMAAKDTFEEAHASARKTLEEIGEMPDRDWTMAGYKHLDVPYGDKNIVNDVEKKLPEFNKPIDFYLNTVKYLKDKFASTPAQKKMIDGLVVKIKKQYDTNI